MPIGLLPIPLNALELCVEIEKMLVALSSKLRTKIAG